MSEELKAAIERVRKIANTPTYLGDPEPVYSYGDLTMVLNAAEAAPVHASQDDARDAAELAEALRRCLSSINETWTVYERAVLAKYDRRVLAAKEK